MADIDIRPYTSNKDLLHQAILDCGSVHRNNKYTCPSPHHEDKNPSTSLYEKDGHWKWRCHSCGAGGDYFDILALTQGTTPDRVIADLKRGEAPPPPRPVAKAQEPKKTYRDLEHCITTAEFVLKGKCTVRHEYNNPDTRRPDVVILRVEPLDGSPKQFWQCHPTDRGWVLGYPEGPRPIYNRGRVARASHILIVEGEKCVEALHEIGLVATTSPGGSMAAAKADWSPLAGKTVYIWRDNDPPNEQGEAPGMEYQKKVIDQLVNLNPMPDIRVIDLAMTGLGQKQDVADYIARERGQRIPDDLIKRQIEDLMADARPEGGSRGLYNLLENIISGTRDIVSWRWDMLSNLTLALQPGTVTMLCGDPGSAKSFFLLQSLLWWHINEHRVAAMMLEDDRDFHLQRALVQLAENNKLFDYHWIKNHGKEAIDIYYNHKQILDTFASTIHDDPDVTFDLPKMAEWVHEQCTKKARIIAIDPITIVETGDKPWIAEREFMVSIKRSIRMSGSSLILVTHPKKNRLNTINLDQLAGSTNYPRFSHTILWLEHLANDEAVDVITYDDIPGGRIERTLQGVKVNKKLHLCKTRLGRGHGYKLAFKMTGTSMCMDEIGLLTKSAQRKN